jgi:hypothetical protein
VTSGEKPLPCGDIGGNPFPYGDIGENPLPLDDRINNSLPYGDRIKKMRPLKVTVCALPKNVLQIVFVNGKMKII